MTIKKFTYQTTAIMGSFEDNSGIYLSPGCAIFVPYGEKLYLYGSYDEFGQESCVIDTSGSTMSISTGGGYTHGFGIVTSIPIVAVAANSNYVFKTCVQGTYGGLPQYPPAGTRWSGFFRSNRSTMAPAGGFSGATGLSGSFKIINTHADTLDQSIPGLACNETQLFVSDPTNSRILVLDTTTLAQTASYSISGATCLTMAQDGNIWVLVGNQVKKMDKSTGSILHTIDLSNKTLYKIGTLSDGKLWVSDSSSRQAYIYNGAGTSLLETYGEYGGVVANNGKIEGKRFGVIGGVYRKNNYTYVLWQFDLNSYRCMVTKHDDNNGGKIVDEMYSWIFIESPDFNGDGSEIHSNFVKTSGNNKYYTYDSNNALGELRGTLFTTHTLYRSFLNKEFLFDTNQSAGNWTIREIVPGVARTRPCGAYKRNISLQSTFWRPSDDGTAAPKDADWKYCPDVVDHLHLYPDINGNLWRLTCKAPFTYTGNEIELEYIPCQGLDANNNPIYTWESRVKEPMGGLLPGSGDSVRRFYYDPITDTGFVSGFNTAKPEPVPRCAGTIFCCYSNWLQIRGPRTLRWTLTPTVSGYNSPISVSADGELFSLGYVSTSAIDIYDVNTGNYLGQIRDTRNVGWNDSNYGHKIKKFDKYTYGIICMKLIGGAAYKFIINASSDIVTGYDIALGNNYFLSVDGDNAYIRAGNLETFKLNFSSAKGRYYAVGQYRDIKLTTLGTLRIDSTGMVGYAANNIGPFSKLFDNKVVYLTRDV